MKKLLLLLLLFCSSIPLLAQDRQIQGIVFDNATKQRLNRVYIYNTRTDKGVYNNTRGEFTLSVRQRDTLVIALQGYAIDTVTVQSQSTIAVYLTPTSIILKEVIITDSLMSPEKRLEMLREAHSNIYRIGNSKDVLSIGPGGVGLGIDALYSMISREGKNARHLQRIIESDYHDAIIDYRFTKNLVGSITDLSGEKLNDFMRQYRPNYYFVLEANDYSFISFIKSNFARYLQNPEAYRLPPLK